MVAELDGGEFWLPAEFFNDDFSRERNSSLPVEAELFTASNVLRSSQQKPAQSFKHPARISSSPATSPVQREIGMDFLYAAAWEVMRMRQMEQKFNGRSRLNKSSSTAEIPFTRFLSSPSPTRQQLLIYQLKRQQLIKQQLAAAWIYQNRPAMASPPLSSHLRRTEMKAIQVDVRGNRRPSAGTGVFLPKREGIHSEALKKPAAFSVLPARDLQALKLNLDDMGFYTPCFERYVVGYELGPMKCYQQQNDNFQIPAPAAPPPPADTSPDVLLPTEWTY